jgi:hypothetical protein
MSGLPSWARVGAKVVCVDAACRPGRFWRPSEAPVQGKIYTVAAAFFNPAGEPRIHLVELQRSPETIKVLGYLAGYRVERFRPLITLEDDLEAHFRILLRQPVSDKEPAL